MIHCKEPNTDLSRRQLDGDWVLVGGCVDGGPTPTSWLEISGIQVRSCTENSGTFKTLKGTLVKTSVEGSYRIDWENSYIQNASDPVGLLKLLSLKSQAGSVCYTQNAQYSPPAGCIQ
ncbi:hypothetical protein JWG44_19360 [Leptospira sp. 201903071]|uniref:hypothetical protein n=1 Tax=Leptospira ainazelensis TaxID=2810034 RepID=UPI0019666D59|nr:hypothetical protein [Leptospira ainazelensis]MBM9502414.1 hypothetical protein [Leptospira ainazelensis]